MDKGKSEKIISDEKYSNKNHLENYSHILNYFKADLKEEKFLKELTCNTKAKVLKNAFNYKKPVNIVKELYTKANLTERLRNLDSEIDIVKLREPNENNFSTINSWRSVTNSIRKSKENQYKTINSQKLFKKEDYLSHFNNNLDFLNNFLANLKNHKEISEKMKKILSCDISMINSENKQIKFFILILDAFHSMNMKELTEYSPDENNLEDIKKKFNFTKISLIDSLFVDFCTHLSISSNFRSEFLQRVWKAKTLYTEKSLLKKNKEIEDLNNKFEIVGKNLNSCQSKLKTSEEKSLQLSEIILKFQKEIKDLNKQLDQRENKITEISLKLNSITKQTELKDNMLKEMFEKVNFRKNRIESSNQKKIQKEAVNYSDTKFSYSNMNNNESAGRNSEKNMLEENISNSPNKLSFLRRQSTSNQVSQFDNGSFNSSNFLDFNNKELIKNRQENLSRKSLKLKILQKNSNSNIFNFRKQMIIDQSVIKMNAQKFEIDIINTGKRQLDLQNYLNKGIEIGSSKFYAKGIQTENWDHEIEIVIDKRLVEKNNDFELNTKNLNKEFTNLTEILEKLKKYFHQNKFDHNEVEYYFQNGFDIIARTSKYIELEVSQSYSNILKDLNFLSLENKKIRKLIDKLAEEQREKEKCQSDTFDVMQKTISGCNSNLLNITNEIEIDKDKLFYDNKLLMSIKKIIELNEIVLVPPKLKSETLSKTNNGLNQEENPTLKLYSGLKLLKEFMSNEDKHPHTFSQKKCIKIIDYVYFNLIGDVYFKNNFNDVHSETPSLAEIDFSTNFRELPLIYFLNRYLIESLSNVKFLEFLKSLAINRSFHKRINLFYKLLIQSEYEEQTLRNERSYDTHILKYVILLIHYIKVENCFHNEEENLLDQSDHKLFLVFNKISNLVSALFDKLPILSTLKQNILNFLTKNKFKYKEKLILIDFDDFMEFYVELLNDFSDKYRKYLRTVFKSIDLEEKNHFNLLDFVIALDALYGSSNNRLTEIKLIFNSKSNENLLKFETFETFIMESDNDNFRLDTEMFREFCDIDEIQIEKSILSLKEGLEGTSVSVFDIIFKRLSVIRNNPYEKILIRKIDFLKDLIVDYDKSNLWVIWISLKIMEKLSEVIYNETKLSNYFKNLSGAYQILSNNTENNPIIIEYLDTL